MVVQVDCCDCHASGCIRHLDVHPVHMGASIAGISTSWLILILSNAGPLHILVANTHRPADPPVPDMCEECICNFGIGSLSQHDYRDQVLQKTGVADVGYSSSWPEAEW